MQLPADPQSFLMLCHEREVYKCWKAEKRMHHVCADM